MAGAILVFDVGIVLRALVDIVDQQRNRRTGGDLLAGLVINKHARENFDGIRLLALGGEPRLAGTAAVEIGLDIGFGQRNARRAAIDHAADRRPVAFAEGRDPEHMAEGVEGHGSRLGARIGVTCANRLTNRAPRLVAR